MDGGWNIPYFWRRGAYPRQQRIEREQLRVDSETAA